MRPAELPPAESFFPARPSLRSLARAVDSCRACPLFANATQGVFGEGPPDARLMFVGEQPGDKEDLAGQPFVGSAGRVLDQYLAEVGVPRERVWVTNAVKHFKFEERGKRRIHKKPSVTEVQACLPWLEAESELLPLEMIVCLGSTATRAVLGPKVSVQRDRGTVFSSPFAPWVMPTYHPSALIRSPAGPRERARLAFREDMRTVAARFSQLA